MKLYSDENRTAPSPRRVRMFVAEKGLDTLVDVVPMALHEDNRSPAFAAKNPMSTLPVLELDDGTRIAESMAICRYLEAMHPEPRLLGATALEIGLIEMWNRRAELAFYLPIEFARGFMGEQAAGGARRRVAKTMRLFDEALSERRFLAGDELSVADITAKVAIDFGVAYNDITVPQDVPHFRRWQADLDARPSAAA